MQHSKDQKRQVILKGEKNYRTLSKKGMLFFKSSEIKKQKQILRLQEGATRKFKKPLRIQRKKIDGK